MQINKAPGTTAPNPAPRPAATGSAPDATPAATDKVNLGDAPPEVQKAMAMLQEAAQARQNFGGQFVQQVVDPAPEEFKAVLRQAAPHIDEVTNELASKGLPADQIFLIASQTKNLVQAGINAEKRAGLQESQHKTADRTALLKDELTFQTQADVLLNAFPEQAAKVAQMPAEGEAQLSAGTFVSEMFKLIPAEQAAQVKEIASHSPLAMAANEKPELLKTAADSLPKTIDTLIPAAQTSLAYFAVIGQVVQEEMQAAQILQSQQPPATPA